MHTHRASTVRPGQLPRLSPGFTLVELMVVISIIIILISLSVVGIARFRKAGWRTDSQNQIMVISQAIQAYYSDFHAYPGPLPNAELGHALTLPVISSTDYDTSAGLAGVKITGSENLVLGLYGGLVYNTNAVRYDPSQVGQGPNSLNPLSPKKYTAYLADAKLLSWNKTGSGKTGLYKDEADSADDTMIPELVDRFPQGMPILYLRASQGAQAARTNSSTNNIITDNHTVAGPTAVGQYQLDGIIGYTSKNIGEGRQMIRGQTAVNNGSFVHGLHSVTLNASMKKGSAGYQYPYDAYPYFTNSTLSNLSASPAVEVPIKKDEYVLISPGPDRIYGTEDDITNFGEVNP